MAAAQKHFSKEIDGLTALHSKSAGIEIVAGQNFGGLHGCCELPNFQGQVKLCT